MKKTTKTSELLEEIIRGKTNEERFSLFDINALLHERGFGIMLLLFSFPMAIPFPYPPGFTTILGLPLLFYGIQMILKRKDPWLPDWIGKKTIKVSHLSFAITKSNKFFKYVEKIMKPRFEMITGEKGERLIGIFVFLCSISIILPIYFGNAIPSLGIFIMSLGMLNKDGLIVIVGMIVSIIGLIISTLVVIIGTKIASSLIDKIVSFIM